MTKPVAAASISEAFSSTTIGHWPETFSRIKPANAAAAAELEKAVSVHAPTLIGLCSLKTRSMLRKRLGIPRSEVRSAGDITAPAAATQLALRARSVALLKCLAAAEITAAAPAAPPAKK